MSPVYSGKVEPVILNDEYGPVNVYMLPFIKPANLKRFYGEVYIKTYNYAVRGEVENVNVMVP